MSQNNDPHAGHMADAAVKSLLQPAETSREAMQRALAVMPAHIRPWYSMLYHIALLFLRMFTLSVEVFLRRQFGERYLTFMGILLGAWTFQIVAALWNFRPSSLIPIYTLGFSFATPRLPQQEPEMVFDLVGFCVVIYYMAAVWHLIAIFMRNREGRLWHTRSSGLSWPIWNWVHLISKRLNFHQDFVKMYIEPALCIGASYGLERYSGHRNFPSTWLFIAGIALLIKGQVEYSERKKLLLDQLDSMIEGRELADALAGKILPDQSMGSQVIAAPNLRGQQKAAVDRIIQNTPAELKRLLDQASPEG